MIKKLFVLVTVLACLVVAAAAAYLFLWLPDVSAAETVRVEANAERLARGEYLARHVTVCVDCHSPRDYTKYAAPIVPGSDGRGGEPFGEKGSAVELYSKNITPAAIGEWSDGELIRAITEGVSRDGTPLFPIMPYRKYGAMARDDIEAIVAYIRTLKPITYEPPARRLGFPLPLVVRTMPARAKFGSRPSPTDRVKYGEYLVNAAACSDCHTPQEQGQPMPGMTYAGGFGFPLPNGGVVRSANITPDADTGIGSWTEDQFVATFKAFAQSPAATLSPAEQRENTIMPWQMYAGIEEGDLRAMYAYLRTLPPVVHRVTTKDPTATTP